MENWAAQRRSIHRERGMIITKPVLCTKDKYGQMLIEKVIPVIKARWPDQNRNIVLQQNGAPAHI